jgi:vacuolar-type H+-ATPase subunit H
VPQVRDFLSRFRPAGSPGAARAGIPADRRSQLAAELEPLLELLDGPDAECAEIIAAAWRDADQITAAARNDATVLVSDARRRAAEARGQILQDTVAAAQAEAANATAAAAAEAAATRDLAGQRLPVLADQAVAMIRELADGSRAASAGWPVERGLPGELS